MIFEEILLLKCMEFRNGFQLPEMRPALLIMAFEYIITALRQYGTYGNMHEILLFFLAEILFARAQFLYADKKKDAVHFGLDAVFLLEFDAEFQPSYLNVFCSVLHSTKIVIE